MDKDNIQEGNLLIAKFLKHTGSDEFLEKNYNQYRNSWDLLRYPIMKAHDECKLYSGGLKFFEGLTIFSTIEQVWLAVVEFIKFNNQNK